MAESSSQIPQQQEPILQQEPNPQQLDQPDKPKSPIPFEPATQVSFHIDNIIFNDDSEMALLYPPHTNSSYFKVVSDFISKCCLRKAFTISPNQYKEYMSEFWYTARAHTNSKVWFSTPTGDILGEVEVNTFRNAIGAHYLSHSSEYVAPPFIETVRRWFPTIGYGEAVKAKGTLKKNMPVEHKALYTSSYSRKTNSKGKKPGAKYGYRKQPTSSKHHPLSKIKATKDGSSKAPTGSQNGHSTKKTQSSSNMDTNPSQPSAFTPVVAEMHKEDQQGTTRPASLEVSGEERADPQINSGMSASIHIDPVYSASFIIYSESTSGCDASADSTAEVDLVKYAPNDSISKQ
ncbi:hypothetical protein Tco_1051018 [Tanacetum coccineum]